MKKPTLLYIPLVLLFAFALSVLAVHFARLYKDLNRSQSQVEMPYSSADGSLSAIEPEGEASGLKVGDRVVAISGRAIDSDEAYYNEISKLRPSETASMSVARTMPDGQTQDFEISFTPKKLEQNFNYYSLQIIGFIFAYFLPTFSILLGFWVVFVRPRDFLAWLLLFVLLGFSSVALEGSTNGLIRLYYRTFFSTWAMAMLLFGIYFPERWSLDEKFPWAKWILIVPLGLQVIFALLGHLETLLGIDALQYLSFITEPYDRILMPLNMAAISLFFVALGYKSGTLQNPDARRRLRLMLIGTTVAMAPSFGIILYRLFSGAHGNFLDLVPFWFAMFALVAMMLFPLTLAYVIVVQRAMDVSVVVRQGLQYALAKNGVFALQILLSIGVILTAVSFASDNKTNRPQKITFIALGVMFVFLIRMLADKIKAWTDRRFFREAYNAEQILSDLSEDVRTMVETKPLLETVSTKISESMHVPQVALLLKNGNGFQPAYALGYENAPVVNIPENTQTIERLRKNEPLIVYQDDENSWINETAQAGERDDLRKLNSQLLLPVGAKNILSGLISLSPKRSEEPYSPNDLRLLKSVAAQTGLALENSRLTEAIVTEAAQRERLNTEIDIAREVQERLFPQELPPIEGLDYFGACRPALGVGGDYYDFIELPENKFGIAIGDISGKGIGASLMMASLQASLRGQAIHFKSDLAGLMKQINSLVYEASTSNRYATFFYAQYEPATRKLAYVNAGHNPPFLVRKDGEVLRLEEGGAVVGMLPPMLVNYKQGDVELQTGDLLVGYTDGISEAMNPQEEEWSEDAMLERIKTVMEKPAAEILPFIVACADQFASGAKQHDDMTMIIVKAV